MAGISPQEFVIKWSAVTLTEKASSQPHFEDLCRLLDQPTPTDADPTGEFYTFEKGVEKTGGGKGFADVWYKDHFAIEYKGKHKDLKAAYGQLLQYRESLENPPLLVVTDIERFEVHTNFTGAVTEVYAFTNDELPEPENLRILRAMFEDPYSLKPTRTVQSVTEEAAGKFARIADGLRERGVDPQEAAHFLNKLLFCLFAEDVGLLKESLFTRVVERGVKRPETFNQNVGALFDAMAAGGEFNLLDVPHFDGGLFSDGGVVPLEASELRVLREATNLDWDSVEPAIFGTLFERSLDPNQRAPLGAHYTSKEDILTLIEPVLMAPLRREWEQVKDRAQAEAEKSRGQGRQAAVNTLRRAERELVGFAERLRSVKVLDPACGSGNFLYVSLKELLDLEKEVSTFAGEIGMTPFFPGVNPEQLHGIETSPYAHELAQVAIWIGYLQWMIDNGFGSPSEPILGPMTNIVEMDAILARDGDGTLREPDWPEADVIVGNPPFLGGNKIRQELSSDYVDQLFELYKGRVPAFADLVCYWFEKARSMIATNRLERGGLLATQGIRGGVNRRVLERIKQTGDIFWAWSDRDWVLEGATVHVSMIGFDNGSITNRTLNGQPATKINPNLTAETDLTTAQRLRGNENICFMGPSPKAPFDIGADLAEQMLAAPINVNGLPNSDVVRPVASAIDLTRRSRGKWTIDFGLMPVEQAAQYEMPFEYVQEHVRPIRSRNRRAAYAEKWWQYAEARPGMRDALKGNSRFIATPGVSKHRIFVWIKPEVLCNQGILVFARDDDYFFGVLHSRAHELWARGTGTQLREAESGFRYTPTSTFETFPLPWPPNEEPEADSRIGVIAQAASRLDGLRQNYLNPDGASEAQLKKLTLTNLYNARPTWLDNAHKKLDAAVFAAYGWPEEIVDEDILKNLLALNLERSERDASTPSLA